jgi:hypothetical protein
MEPAGLVLEGLKVNAPLPEQVSCDGITDSIKPKRLFGNTVNPSIKKINNHFFIANEFH